MHELPIVILSKQLKYSLATDKVKTLEKAVELLPKIPETEADKINKIKELSQKYKSFEEKVKAQFNYHDCGRLGVEIKGENNQGLIPKLSVPMPLYQLLTESGIVEIAGAKGSGKSCLLLHLAEQFIQIHAASKQVFVLILNCATGITLKRIQKLQNMKNEKKAEIEYYDIGNAEDAYMITEQVLKKLLEDGGRKKMIIMIDSLVTLLLPKEKSKPAVSRLMKNFKAISAHCLCVALFTNFIQHKFQIGHEELANHASYHAQITGEYLTNKLYTEKPDKSFPNMFRVSSVKGRRIDSVFRIAQHGVSEISPINASIEI